MALVSERETATARTVTNQQWSRWEPLVGIAFVVLFIAGFATSGSMPNGNDSNKKWVDYFASSGHQIAMLVAGFLLVLAGVCLAWFLTMLWSRVAAARRPQALSPLGLVAAGLAAAGVVIGGVFNAVIAGAMIFPKLPEPPADILKVFGQIPFPLIAVAGMIPLALALGTLGLQARRNDVFGKGLTIFTMVAAVAALFAFVFFPIALVIIWFLVASTALYRRRPAPAG